MISQTIALHEIACLPNAATIFRKSMSDLPHASLNGTFAHLHERLQESPTERE